jgi:hypothetical protein
MAKKKDNGFVPEKGTIDEYVLKERDFAERIHKFCRLCGQEILRTNDISPEQHDQEKKMEMHRNCYNRERERRMIQAREEQLKKREADLKRREAEVKKQEES